MYLQAKRDGAAARRFFRRLNIYLDRRVLALTAAVPMAVQAIRQGAADVIQRSTRQGSILARIEKVLASTDLTTRSRPPSVPDT